MGYSALIALKRWILFLTPQLLSINKGPRGKKLPWKQNKKVLVVMRHAGRALSR